MLEALNLIVEKFGGIASEESAASVFSQLARIGSSNPILSLVSVASTFGKDQLAGVLAKLNGLIESLNASLSEDRFAESQAVADFNALAGELSSTKGSLTSLRSNLSSELIQKRASHAFHSDRLTEANLSFAVNSDLKIKKQGQC